MQALVLPLHTSLHLHGIVFVHVPQGFSFSEMQRWASFSAHRGYQDARAGPFDPDSKKPTANLPKP